MSIMPVAEWSPDEPDLSDFTNIASNVIALTPQSYGPVRAQVAYSTNAIDSVCLGMGSAEDIDNDHFVFAGTTTKLWAITVGARVWEDLSGSPYMASGNWYFAQYKNAMLATDYDNPIQILDMDGGGVFGQLSASAPKARYIAVAKSFVIVADTNDPVGGPNPTRLWWSGINDPTNWPTPGTALAQQVMSDYNDMPGPMGNIMGLTPNLAGCDCAVFFERGVFRMIFAGPPAVFDFYPATAVKGTPAPNSIVPLGNYVYYLGEDGFYLFDGNSAVPIGANKVDRWFFANMDQRFFTQVIGAPDIANKAICWAFCSVNASQNDQLLATESGDVITTEDGNPLSTSGPLPDMMLIYRWDIQRWSISSYDQQWIARVPVVSSTTGTPPSEQALNAGQLQLASLDSSQHLAFFTGTNLPAQIGTKVVQISEGARTFVNATRPLIDAAQSGFLVTESGDFLTTEAGDFLTTESSGASVTVAMSARNTYQDPEVFGPEQPIDISGQCSQRSEGRYHRGRITVSSGVWMTNAGLDVTGQRASLR